MVKGSQVIGTAAAIGFSLTASNLANAQGQSESVHVTCNKDAPEPEASKVKNEWGPYLYNIKFPQECNAGSVEVMCSDEDELGRFGKYGSAPPPIVTREGSGYKITKPFSRCKFTFNYSYSRPEHLVP